MQVIEAFNQNGLYFLLFALCLDADSIPETTRFVIGRRAKTETYSAKYIYTWVLLLGMWLLVVALKFYFTMLFLWLIPLLVLIYGTALHAYPYLFAGVAACPPHSGPAVEMAGICTLLAFLLVFCGYRACWLFPCLCAPEVPGWIFFPPNEPPDNPIRGDVDLQAFRILLDHLGKPWPEDCVWEPPGWTPVRGPRLPEVLCSKCQR
mmetsp:Transcript_14864/g.46542  ORF Transcript_14864/g.46542 Transcript_14864/m.46542 type:complete len:206 (-) Transcript_14864:1263-1880(-)